MFKDLIETSFHLRCFVGSDELVYTKRLASTLPFEFDRKVLASYSTPR